jgi:hypothetical protein
MRIRILALAIACLARSLEAAQSSRAPDRDAELETLAQVAATLRPEFSADVLLRLAGSPRIADPAWKRELIDAAWERTYLIGERYRRAASNPPPDTWASALTRAYETGLDRVSLQARAVRAMTLLSPRRAREMFEWIDFELKPGACEDPLVPVLDDYYDALAMVARLTVGSSFMDRADALGFFELYMWKAARPSEMVSAAKAVISYRPDADDALYLENVLRWIFEHGDIDPRGLSVSGPELVSKVGEIDMRHRGLGVTNATLLRGLRRYLVAQLSGPRCADSLTERTTFDAFNRLIARRGDPDLAAMPSNDARPSRILPTMRHERLWQTAESSRLRGEAARLLGDPRKPLSDAAKNTREWQDRATQFLADLERWNGAREPKERDFVYEKSILLIGLVEIAPSGPLRMRALRDSVAFLRRTAGSEPAASWFVHLTRLLDAAHGRDRVQILDALESSEEPTMIVYAHIDRKQLSRRPS